MTYWVASAKTARNAGSPTRHALIEDSAAGGLVGPMRGAA